MADMKKRWVKPQLVILGRGTPAEAVLQLCSEPPQGGKGCSPKSSTPAS